MEAASNIHAPILHASPEAQATVGKVLARIQTFWNLNNLKMSQLLHTRANTYGNWLKQQKVPLGSPPFTADAQAVIGVLSIHRSLAAMFQASEDQILWLNTPHPDFQNQTPFDFACESVSNLFYLKAYLDYVRGRGA